MRPGGRTIKNEKAEREGNPQRILGSLSKGGEEAQKNAEENEGDFESIGKHRPGQKDQERRGNLSTMIVAEGTVPYHQNKRWARRVTQGERSLLGA